jgi:anti-sigma regulatory factor (Ser/Thr protein kinase)
VTGYLETVDLESRDSIKARGHALAQELTGLAGDRMGLLPTATRSDQTLPLTHHAGIDAILSYMENRMKQEGISFEVKLHTEFAKRFEEAISEADLTHLLSDLLENAIIATQDSEKRIVQVHLGILDEVPTVTVSDSGKPFDPAVYQDFGLAKHSTHLDDGGSGIGLMDIWSLKKKYAASLHIYEYAPETNSFTKMISLVFDRKKHYLIQTYRPKELVQMQTRSDLYILPL